MRLFPLLMIVLALVAGQRVFGLLQSANAADPKPAEAADTATKTAKKSTKDSTEKPAEIEVGSLEGRELIDFTESELNLLQSLRERREELRQQEAKIQQQQRVLTSMEQRLDKKVKELESIKGSVDATKAELNDLSKKFRQNEDKQIASLVRIYEKMKPKDAAKILNSLELSILLEVIRGMKDTKVAPILANMRPDVATMITAKLGQREELPKLAEEVAAEAAEMSADTKTAE